MNTKHTILFAFFVSSIISACVTGRADVQGQSQGAPAAGMCSRQLRGNDMIHEAAATGNLRAVQEMVQLTPSNANLPGVVNWTPLHCAVMNGHVAIVEFLLRSKADPNIGEGEGNTSLHFAVYRKGRENLSKETYIGIIQLLLDSKADVNARNYIGAMPLHSAVIRGADAAAVELLIEGKADVSAKVTQGGWTPLHGAASVGRTDLVEILIKQGADIQTRDARGLTPLEVAEKMGHSDVVKLLRANVR